MFRFTNSVHCWYFVKILLFKETWIEFGIEGNYELGQFKSIYQSAHLFSTLKFSILQGCCTVKKNSRFVFLLQFHSNSNLSADDLRSINQQDLTSTHEWSHKMCNQRFIMIQTISTGSLHLFIHSYFVIYV